MAWYLLITLKINDLLCLQSRSKLKQSWLISFLRVARESIDKRKDKVMKKSAQWLVACTAMTVLLTGTAFAADQGKPAAACTATNSAVAVKAQTLCPVMGGPVDNTTEPKS